MVHPRKGIDPIPVLMEAAADEEGTEEEGNSTAEADDTAGADYLFDSIYYIRQGRRVPRRRLVEQKKKKR